MKELTIDEFLALFDASVHPKLRSALSRCDALACFENLDMCSSQFGARTALMVGPGCTYKRIQEVEGHHLNDLPSQRQYPVAYVQRVEVES